MCAGSSRTRTAATGSGARPVRFATTRRAPRTSVLRSRSPSTGACRPRAAWNRCSPATRCPALRRKTTGTHPAHASTRTSATGSRCPEVGALRSRTPGCRGRRKDRRSVSGVGCAAEPLRSGISQASSPRASIPSGSVTAIASGRYSASVSKGSAAMVPPVNRPSTAFGCEASCGGRHDRCIRPGCAGPRAPSILSPYASAVILRAAIRAARAGTAAIRSASDEPEPARIGKTSGRRCRRGLNRRAAARGRLRTSRSAGPDP